MKWLFSFSFLLLFVGSFASGNASIGAESAALGGASVSLTDVWSNYNNQAGLAFVQHISAGVCFENRFLAKELGLKSLAVAVPVRGGVFGASVSSFGYDLYSENKYGIAFAKAFGDKLSAGIQLDYLHTHIADVYGSKGIPMAEVGVMARPVKDLVIGVHLFNPTRALLSSYNDERVPTIFRVGANYRFSEKVFVCAESTKDINQPAQLRGGISYSPVKIFTLRAGLAGEPSVFCFGFGLHLENFTLDMASTYHSILGFSPRVGLSWKANPK